MVLMKTEIWRSVLGSSWERSGVSTSYLCLFAREIIGQLAGIVKRHEARTLAYICYEVAALTDNKISHVCQSPFMSDSLTRYIGLQSQLMFCSSDLPNSIPPNGCYITELRHLL
jgi:hypothetical protein